MTRDEMLGSIIAMRLQFGWQEPTPETEALRVQAAMQIDAIEAVATAAQDMSTIQLLDRKLREVLPWYYCQLAALESRQAK